jgi:ADP-ribose pyrophosphatase YjhB (NUDIX family)
MNIMLPITQHIKDSHCSFCGARFTEQILWPRKCFTCWNESYKNPIPIVVSMIGVEVDNRMGILIQQRNIEPQKGGWALPSGYINHGETWEEAAVRENEEEMGLRSQIEEYYLYVIRKPVSGNMLIFCRTRKVWAGHVMEFIDKFVPNEEVSTLGIYYGDTELAFPIHNECAVDFLAKLKNTQSPWNY